MGWLIALGIIVLLAIMPRGVSVRYNAAGPYVALILGPGTLQLIPGKKKADPKEKPKNKQQPKQTTTQAEKPASSEKGGSVTDFLALLRLAFDLLVDFRRKLRVRILELKLTLAGGDPCDLAVNYGKTWTAVGNLLPALERWFVIKKRDVEVECDFTASETKVIARLEITMTLGRLISLAAVYAVRGLKEFIQFRNIRKGCAVK